jgi:hypothetical protein
MSRAYLCVSIDVESDRARGGRARHPASFEGITDGVVARLHPLFERFGATPTYLLSAEVLRDAMSVATFADLAPSCELGTLGSERGDRDALTELTDLFIRAFGHQPQSFRRPPSPVGGPWIESLASLGYTVDASVTPRVERFRDASSQPYRPDAESPAAAGDAPLLEVPITIRSRLLREPRWLSPSRTSASALVRVADEELTDARQTAAGRPVLLHATLANVDVVPRASPRGANEEEARCVLDGVRALLSFARRGGIEVIGLGDVPSILAASR